MALERFYLTALDAACARAKAGAKGITTYNDGDTRVGVNELGGVEVYLSGKARTKSNFDQWCAAGRERSANNSVSCATPVIGAWDMGFKAK